MPVSLDAITDGGQQRLPFGIILGAEGTGKSSLPAHYPNPIFIRSEEGTGSLKVKETPKITEWNDVLEWIKLLGSTDHPYQTVVIDSLTRLEPLLHAHMVKEANGLPLEKIAGGYYRWRDVANGHWQTLVNYLRHLQKKKGVAIFAIAHTALVDVEDPRVETYQTHTLAVDKTAGALLAQQFDFVGYLTVDVVTRETSDEERKLAATTGKRKIYFNKHPAYTAKKRNGLPDSIDLSPDAKTGSLAFQAAWAAANAALDKENAP